MGTSQRVNLAQRSHGENVPPEECPAEECFATFARRCSERINESADAVRTIVAISARLRRPMALWKDSWRGGRIKLDRGSGQKFLHLSATRCSNSSAVCAQTPIWAVRVVSAGFAKGNESFAASGVLGETWDLKHDERNRQS